MLIDVVFALSLGLGWCRFEQLALEYDSDELGDLEDVEGGGAGLDAFGSVLKKSMAQQVTRVPLVEALQRAHGHAAGPSDLDDDARIAVQKVSRLAVLTFLYVAPIDLL